MKLVSGGLSDTGKVRQRNEDCIRIEPELGLFIVADGMGGYAGGDVASSIACETITSQVRAARDLIDRFGQISSVGDSDPFEFLSLRQQIMSMISDAIVAADVEIQRVAAVDAAAGSNALTGMGSTVVLALVVGARAFVAHLGDSRAYLLGREGAVRLTLDHSLLQGLVDGGQISQAEIARFPMKNVLTKALGVPGGVVPDVMDFLLRPGERILLCSDGLHGLVRDDFLFKLGHKAAPTHCASRLVAYANAAGGNDNISVVLVEAVEDDPGLTAEVTPGKGWAADVPEMEASVSEVDHDIDGATLTPAPSGTAAVRAASRAGGPCVGDRVREHSLFRGLTHGEWLRMFSSTPRQCFESGATIFSAGELSDGMYAILCGSVEVTKDGNVIKVFGPGSTLGEMCLVDERVRLANAVARGRTVLMFLSRHSFQTMCDKQPVTAVRLLRQLQSRTASWLRDARDELNIMKAFVAGFEAERLDSVDR